MCCWRRMEISWTCHVKNEVYYMESRRKGISHMQYKEGRLTGLVTSCIETAFYNMLLKEG